jgi:glycosyltransferase involved in cell wall biosynthesis
VRVAIDARPAVFPEKTGIGYYTWHLLRHLPAVDPRTRYVAWYLNARALLGGRRRLLGEVRAPNLAERWTPIPSGWFERSSEWFDLPRVEWFVRCDVFFAPNFVPPPTRSRALVVTVHDLAFRLFPQTAPQSTRWWLRRIDRSLERASRVIVPSHATKKDLLELYPVPPDRVVVIPHGVDGEVFRAPTPEAVQAAMERFSVDGPYVLSLGGLEPRKNLPNLVRAFDALPDDIRPGLVIAGAGVEWNPEGRRLLESALSAVPRRVRDRIVLTGYVSGPDKVALLGGAEALAYPSLYEGFGLPVLEAMACGTPVLTANVSALPEVAGDAALLVDPGDHESIADGLERLLRDTDLREQLKGAGVARAAGFTWPETAERTADVLHQAGAERGIR